MQGDLPVGPHPQDGQSRPRLTEKVIERLKQPMDLGRVKTRRAPGGGVVPYISGEDAIDTANRIFDFDWSSDVGETKFVATEDRVETQWNSQAQKREETGERKATGIYFVTVSVRACGITKTDVGRCICEGNTAEAHDMAIAGAVTDGMKRAFRQFGDQFGNVLYDKDSAVFKEALQGQAPAWQKPNGALRKSPAATPERPASLPRGGEAAPGAKPAAPLTNGQPAAKPPVPATNGQLATKPEPPAAPKLRPVA